MHIQELETRTGLDRATIRYYEKEGLICPNRLQNGYRDYSKKDLEDLLRIKLLRMLDVPLDQIIMIRKGKVTVGAALTHRFNMLNDERQHLDQIEAVCNELIRSTCVFDELDPVPYLAMFSGELPHKITEFSLNTAEQVVPEQPHPFRRYFARWFDLNLYSVILAVIWYFILNIRPFLNWHDTVLGIMTVFLSIPVNAVLLAKFGTTCGKRLMGISLEAVDDAEITFRDALRREWNVFRYGYGFNIPIYSLWRLYKNYNACKAGEWHDWEEYGSEIKYHCYTKNYRRIFLLFTGIIVIITIIIAFFANFPPNYGTPMTIGELAENYNAVAAKYGSISRMDQTGQIYEDETSHNRPIVAGGNGDQVYEINTNNTIELEYVFNQEYIKEIHYTGRWENFLMISTIPNEFTYLVYSASAGDYIINKPESRILEAIRNQTKSGEIIMDHITVLWSSRMDHLSLSGSIVHSEKQNTAYIFDFTIVFH